MIYSPVLPRTPIPYPAEVVGEMNPTTFDYSNFFAGYPEGSAFWLSKLLDSEQLLKSNGDELKDIVPTNIEEAGVHIAALMRNVILPDAHQYITDLNPSNFYVSFGHLVSPNNEKFNEQEHMAPADQ